MRVAVTGGSGVVGAAVVRHLVAEGHEVSGLARSEASASKLESMGAVPVAGDLMGSSGLERLVDGCDWVFHIAGINEMCTRRPEVMWRVNVDGTRSVLRACIEGGVGRLVHTSSATTIGEAAGSVGREDSRHRGFYLSEYEKSKTAAERLVLEQAGSLDVVCVNPSSVQGPGRSTGTGELMLRAARGSLPFLVDTTISIVDIDDCARGHLLAASRGARGERYVLSGVALDIRTAVALLAEATGRDLELRLIPPPVLSGLGTVLGGIYSVTRRTPPICRESARVIRHGHRYDGSRATRELGLEYTPVEETLRRTIEWFESEGFLS